MSIAAYVPTDRLHALAAGADLPDRSRGAALFADLAGFTRLTELLAHALGPERGAEELTQQLNRVYGVLLEAVERFGGSVVSFSGDAVTCWFDAQGAWRYSSASAGSTTTTTRKRRFCWTALCGACKPWPWPTAVRCSS